MNVIAALVTVVTLAGGPVRDQIGVNIHFTGAPQPDLELLREAGFGWIRMDFVWQAVERESGEYRFEAYDRLVEAMTDRQIHILFILDYSNRLYEEDRSVRTERGRKAFARFASTAAARYRGKGIRWEIWNEPNLGHFWNPQPGASDYLALARAASEAIRAADPAARVVGPATSGFPWEFLEQLLRGGFLSLVDEVSVHPYRSKPPETARADYARLRRLIEEHTPAGQQPVPVISGEWGYSLWHWGEAISPRTQAAYLARQFLTNISEGVPLSIWYDWADDGEDPRETEHNFGTVTAAREPKPAYLAVKTLSDWLGTARFERRLEAAEGDHVLLLAGGRGGRSYLAAWTTRSEHSVRVTGKGLDGAVHCVDATGGRSTVTASEGELGLALGDAPRYVQLPGGVSGPDLEVRPDS